jgi:hypothetical protein
MIPASPMTASAPRRDSDAIQVDRPSRPAHHGGVLVAIATFADAVGAVQLGVMIAKAQRSRLRLVAIAPGPAATFALAALGVTPDTSIAQLEDELLDHAGRVCQLAAHDVPREIPVEFSVNEGQPSRILRRLVERGAFSDVVLSGEWTRGRSMRRAIRTWSGAGIAIHASWPASTYEEGGIP